MDDDAVSEVESRYQITELPAGFIVTGEDRNPVTVELENVGFCAVRRD